VVNGAALLTDGARVEAVDDSARPKKTEKGK
jgi:hypothetical protein